MQLYTDDHKDLRLLDLRGLTPLDADMVGGEPDLMAMIAGHNDRCARVAARLRHLTEGRRRLSNFDAWRDQDGAALIAERARLHSETWDALWELRHALEEREDVLAQIAQRLRERYDAANQAHDQAVAATERRLAKEHRAFVKANAATASSHLGDLVAADASVREAAKRVSTASDALNGIAEARRAVMGEQHDVVARQREVFASMVR